MNTALIRFIYPARRLGQGVGFNAMTVATTTALGPPADVKVMIYGNDAAPLLLAANKGDVLPYLATANGPTLPAASNGSSGSNASSGSAPPAGTLLSPPVLPNGGSQYMVLQVNGAGLGVFDWVRAH